MGRVFAIAPYEGLKSLILSIAPEYPNLFVRCEVGNLSEGRRLTRMAIAEGYDVILLRGGTVSYIESPATVPVVEIGVSGYDVLYSIALSQNYSGKKAVVGFERVTRGYTSICKLLKYDVDIYTIHSEDELLETLCELREKGINVVIGDVITMQVAQQIGMNSLLITSGEDSVREAFKQIEMIEKCTGEMLRGKRLVENLLWKVRPYACVLSESGELRYGRFPERVSARALTDALVEHGELLKKNGTDMLVFEDESGLYVKAGGFLLQPVGDSVLHAWKLEIAEGPVAELPAGVSIQNSDKIAAITSASFVGHNEAFGALLRQTDALSRVGSSVLIEGERGLGKTRLAHMIYRADDHLPLVTIDCACAGPDVLPLLVEMTKNTQERFTLLWLHLDCLSAQAQQALLADHKVLGRFRHIATVERSIEGMAEAGRFSERLLDAFNFTRVSIPPLRERPEDIDDLLSLLIGAINIEIGKQIVGVTRSASDFIKKQSWFGNETQLRETLRRAMLETDEPYIQKKTVETLVSAKQSNINNYNISEDMTLDAIEREIILYVLRDENMNQVKAAQRLGISRTTLWRKIR